MKFVSHDDVNGLLDIAEAVYPAFDRARASAWAHSMLGKPDIALMRHGEACVIASITQAFWGGPLRCYLLFAFGRPGPRRIWDVLRLMREVDLWRRERGAEAFHFGEDTGIDFAPLAKRLGAKLDRPNWKIEGGHRLKTEVRPWSPTLTAALLGNRRSILEQVLGN